MERLIVLVMVVWITTNAAAETLICSTTMAPTQTVGVPFKIDVKSAPTTTGNEVWVYDNLEEVTPHRVSIQGSTETGQWIAVTLNSPGRGHRLTFVSVTSRADFCETPPFDVVMSSSDTRKMTSEPLSLSGVVIDARDQPVEGAVVQLSLDGFSADVATTVTDANGTYTFQSLKEPGEYRVTISAYGWRQRVERAAVVGLTTHKQQPHITRMTVRDVCKTTKVPVILLPGVLESTLASTSVINTYPRLPKTPCLRWDSSELTIMEYTFLGWKELVDLLKSNGYTSGCDLFVVPYDWSLDVITVRDKVLVPWIKEAKRVAQSSKVDIIGHSMGGIVARSYVQSLEYADDVGKLALVGTPSMGSIISYHVWEGNDPIASDLMTNSEESVTNPYLYTNTLNYLSQDRHGSDVCTFPTWYHPFTPSTCNPEAVHQLLHSEAVSLGQLMPIYDLALTHNGTAGVPIVVMENTLLKALNNMTCSSNNKGQCVDPAGVPYKFQPPQSVLTSKVHTKLFISALWTTPQTIPVTSPGSQTVYPDGKPAGSPKVYGSGKGDQTVVIESVLFGSDHWTTPLEVAYCQPAKPRSSKGPHDIVTHDVGAHMFLMYDFRWELLVFLAKNK